MDAEASTLPMGPSGGNLFPDFRPLWAPEPELEASAGLCSALVTGMGQRAKILEFMMSRPLLRDFVTVKRIGMFCLPGRGHLYPATALGARLRARGHEITVFNRSITRAIVNASGLSFVRLEDPFVRSAPLPWPEPGEEFGPNSLNVVHAHALLILRQAYDALRKLDIEALLVDQWDLAAGTVADFLRIPFVTLALLPLDYLKNDTPPVIFGWQPNEERFEHHRNQRGNTLLRRLLAPTLGLVNEERRKWDLPVFSDINDVLSQRAIVTQLPKAFDFPRSEPPPNLFYTGPFDYGGGRPCPNFPWDRLNGRPLVYACLGTVRNGDRRVFEMIAEACSHFDVQLVISLGGMALVPEEFEYLRGNPIVVHYGPQADLLKRAALAIHHGGINTTLESISHGIPALAIPVTDDQPGVAARVAWRGLGLALPFRKLSVARLQHHIQTLLTDSRYRLATLRMQAQFAEIHGLDQAAEIVERAIS